MTSREKGGAIGALLVLILLAGGGAAAWWWMHKDDGKVAIDKDRLVKVERRNLVKAVIATGRIDPLARVQVMSRASGIIKELLVDSGDRVKQGQVIAELDREQLDAQHNENKGNLASAQARLKAANARLEEARVKLSDPELTFAHTQEKRMTDLFAAGNASQTELDDATLRRMNVEYRITQTRASIPTLEAGVAQAEADVQSAQAAVERSATSLREATIKSPIDGIVLTREKEVGDGVSSILTAGGNATAVMVLADASKMFVKAKVDEVDVGKIYEGMRAIVTADAHRDHPFEGKVVRIAPAGTVDNNGIVSFEVKIAVDDPEQKLRVDMTANVRLVIEDRPNSLSLPQRALARARGGSWTVDLVKSETPPVIQKTSVEVGVSDGLVTEILTGVAEGDRVVIPDGADGPQLGRS